MLECVDAVSNCDGAEAAEVLLLDDEDLRCKGIDCGGANSGDEEARLRIGEGRGGDMTREER